MSLFPLQLENLFSEKVFWKNGFPLAAMDTKNA